MGLHLLGRLRQGGLLSGPRRDMQQAATSTNRSVITSSPWFYITTSARFTAAAVNSLPVRFVIFPARQIAFQMISERLCTRAISMI